MAAPVIASTATSGSATCNKPTGTVDGDLLVAFASDASVAAISSPAGWTEIIETGGMTVAWKIAASEGSSYTFTNAECVVIHRITGSNTSAPIDVHGNAHAGVANPKHATAPSVTTTVADCLLLYGADHKGSGSSFTSTPPTGYTELSEIYGPSKQTLTTAYKTLTAAGATGAASGLWTEGDGTNRTSVHVAIAPGSSPQTISPSSIASAEVFGTPTIAVGVVTLVLNSIASSEAFGSPTLIPGTVTVQPAAITSAETFGTLSVTTGAVTIQPQAITSGEVFGTPVIVAEAVTISPTSITSAEAFGTLTVVVGTVIVQPQTIASGEAFGTPTLVVGAVTIQPQTIASAEMFGGLSYLLLDGVNDFVESPDSPSLSITGDIDIRCAVTMDDWTPAASVAPMVSKDAVAAGTRSYGLSVLSNGRFRFGWSVNGTSLLSATSSAAPVVANGELLLFRCTLDVNNGAGGRAISFYIKETTLATADIDAAADTDWVQLGSTITQSGTTSIFDSEAGVAVGRFSGEASLPSIWAGRVHAIVIKDGINGTVVASPDFTNAPLGTGAVVDAQGNVWTLFNGAIIKSDLIVSSIVTVLPATIPSAEVFGSPTLSLYLVLSGIASAETFGTIVVTPGTVTILPTTITSAEAFGTPTISVGAIIVQPVTITSAEAFGTPVVVVGAVIVSPDTITSAEAFGTPTIVLYVLATTIPSEESFGTLTLSLYITLTGIVSAESFGTPIVTPGAVTILPDTITSSEAFGTPVISVGAATIAPASIASSEAFGIPVIVVGAVTVAPDTIPSAEGFGTPFIGAFTIVAPASIPSTETFGTLNVIPGGVVIEPSTIPSAEVVSGVNVVYIVNPDTITSGEVFGIPIFSFTLGIRPDSIPSAESFGTPVLTTGAITIYPSTIASAEVFGTLRIGEAERDYFISLLTTKWYVGPLTAKWEVGTILEKWNAGKAVS